MLFWVRFVIILLLWLFSTPFYFFVTLFKWMGSDTFEIQVAGVTLSIGFCVIGTMSLVSIIATYFIEPGLVSKALSSASQVSLLRMSNCPQCQQAKPERAHHCRRAGACYLRMDHYCHSLGIVVALRNHKPFVAMLAWTVIQGVFSVAVDVASMFVLNVGALNVVFLVWHVLVCIVVGTTLVDQLILIGKNVTVIEKFQKIGGRYDRGVWANFDEFFGKGIPVLRALVPRPSPLTGLEWSMERRNYY